MSQRLQFVKWKESAFSTEQLKGVRWLLGARPKNIPEALHEALTVTPTAQKMLMDLHVKRFGQATRRVKASARRFARSSPEDFEKLVDYACVFAYLRQSAKQATSDPKVDDKLVEAFMARCFSLFDFLFFFPFFDCFERDCSHPVMSGTTSKTSKQWWPRRIRPSSFDP